MKARNFVLPAYLLVFCWSCAYSPMLERPDIPLLQEVAIGKKLFPWAVQKMGGAYSDPELAAFVEGVGRKLEKHTGRSEVTYHFQVVNTSKPGAFAFPGGFVGITRGLLQKLEDEAQLAAVLGHQMAHIEDYHLNDALQDSALYPLIQNMVFSAGNAPSYDQSVVDAQELVSRLLAWDFSLKEERDADLIAVGYMARTGYDPRGMLQLIDIWSSFEASRRASGNSSQKIQPHSVTEERWIITKRYVDNFLYPGNRSRYQGDEVYATATKKLRQNSHGYDLFDQAAEMEKKGDFNQAVALYLKAAAETVDEPLILCRLGLAYLKAGEKNSAGHYLRQAVRLGPNYYYPRLGLGFSLLENGEPDQAIVHLETGMRLFPTIEGAFLLAEAYERQGKRPQAVSLYADVVKAEPFGKFGRRASERHLQLKNN